MDWINVNKKNKDLDCIYNVFIKNQNINKSKFILNTKMMEDNTFLEKIKQIYYFKIIKENKYFNLINNCDISTILNTNINLDISMQNFYKIYYNNDINIINKLKLTKDKYLISYKIQNNYKLLNIIIYYFEEQNIYCIVSYHNFEKKRLLFVNNYLELLLYLFKMEKDLNLNPYYTKIINKYPSFFFDINYNVLCIYFNNFDIFWT